MVVMINISVSVFLYSLFSPHSFNSKKYIWNFLNTDFTHWLPTNLNPMSSTNIELFHLIHFDSFDLSSCISTCIILMEKFVVCAWNNLPFDVFKVSCKCVCVEAIVALPCVQFSDPESYCMTALWICVFMYVCV